MKRFFTQVLTVLLAFTALPALADDVAYNLNPTVSPRNLSEVERGAKVILDFGDVQVNNPDNVPVTATPMDEDDQAIGEAETLRLHLDSEGVVYFNFDVTGEAGTYYKLTIARGAITSADGTRATMAKSWHYYLAEDPEPVEGAFKLLSVEPVSGSTIKPGTTIDLFFSEDVNIENSTGAVTVTNVATSDTYNLSLDWNWNTFDFSNIRFTLPKNLADGTYTFAISGDNLSGDPSGENCDDILLQYTVTADGGSEPTEPTPVEVKNFSPAASEVQALSNIINVGFKSQLASLADGVAAELKNDATGKTYEGIMTILENVEKTIKIEFNYGEDANTDGYLCVAGSYTLTIAANAIIGQDGGTNAEITNTWTVIGVVDVNDIEYTSVLPANGSSVSSISSILISFPETPSLTKKSDAKITVDGKEYDFTLENNVITAMITPEITAAGTYEVTLPAGAVYSLSDGHGNKAIALSFTIEETTSIEALFADGAEAVTIYNCQGICINSCATAQDMRNLPAGLYIVNGIKVMKR